MKPKVFTFIFALLFVAQVHAWAAGKKAPQTPLTDAGQKLLERYTRMLASLKAEITEALPTLEEQKKSAYLKACEAELAAAAAVKKHQNTINANKKQMGMTDHWKRCICQAAESLNGAKEKLDQAKTMKGTDEEEANAVKLARDALARHKAGYEKAVIAFRKSQNAVDKAKQKEPKLTEELDAARKALAKAHANTLKADNELNLDFLESGKLDRQLVKYVVLLEATPRGLAEFAQQGKVQAGLIEKLLVDNYLMKQAVVADGAKNGKYGRAMEIYTAIQKATAKASEGVLQRLALAISLEHAVPVKQRNPTGQTDAPATVDPVNRYLHFEKAYLGGELDPGFRWLGAWDYRMVVNGYEPDETLAWGRKMLANYRPDHISTSDYRWRYVAVVRTDVRYGSQDNKYDKPELQFFQNILMNGGVCGRRAFFGRFILRAFGIPTTARPQRGHASLAHWTPDGWVICLGGGWGAGWVYGHNKDLDFLAGTQARNSVKYLQVKRAQWVGDVMGEKRIFGLLSGDPAFWNSVALYRQWGIIQEAKVVALAAAVGEDIGEANVSRVKEAIKIAALTKKDRKIVVGAGGVITIPAAACSKPTNSTRKIVFMKSNLGGMQLHYNRLGKGEEFEYTFDAPAAGKYALTARVVTPSWKQHLSVAANGAKTPIDIALPHTVGMWDKTQPVTVSLVKGKNVLKFSREHERLKGLTIKDFTLTPVKK